MDRRSWGGPRFCNVLARVFCAVPLAFSAYAEGGYTNHAGNVVAGWPVKLTQTKVTLAERAPANPAPSTLNRNREKALEKFINGVGDIKIGIKAYSRSGN